MTDTTGQLTERQKDALNFTFADHLIVIGERDDARKENAELRVLRAEDQAKLEGMEKLNDMYRDQLNVAITDRKLAMDKLAVLVVRFDMMRKCLDPVQEV